MFEPIQKNVRQPFLARYQPGEISNRRTWPAPAGAAPKFDTYNRPSGPKVMPVGTERLMTTSSIAPDLFTRTTFPNPGAGKPGASESSSTYSRPSGPKSTATTVVK